MTSMQCDIGSSEHFFQPFLQELAIHHQEISGREGDAVFRRRNEAGYAILDENGTLVVECHDLAAAGRALGALMAGTAREGYEEKPAFGTNGIMLDCSRHAVPTVPFLKAWLRKMALTGHNLLMLYAEDVFELPGEPFFGYLRGGFTAAEIREIDDYAALLGIELVPCVETLGHMEQMLRWPCYEDVRDTDSILLIGEEKTYDLIRKIVDFWSSNVRSRRIHVGMDEAWGVGCGAYMRRNGPRPRGEILEEHIGRVMGICKDAGLRPLIWSDLLVRRGVEQSDEDLVKIGKSIPRDVDLACWDYYDEDAGKYTELIRKHLKTGHRTMMASAVWSWATLWYGREYTEKRMVPALEAAKETGIDEWVVTMWGDDGNLCDVNSCWNGIVLSAGLVWGGCDVEKRYAALFSGVSYRRNQKIARMNDLVGKQLDEFMTTALLWDDPLLAPAWHQCRAGDPGYWERRRKTLDEALAAIPVRDPSRGEAGDLVRIRLILRFLIEKIVLRNELEAYRGQKGNREDLHQLAHRYLRQARRAKVISTQWRESWMSRYKPYGFEVIQTRLAGQAARQEEMSRRILEWANGDVDDIPELAIKDIRCTEWLDWTWDRCFTGSANV